MRTVRTFVLRSLVSAAILALISIVLVPSAPSGSPYLSPLSNLIIGDALAKPSCQNTICKSPSTCGTHLKGYNCTAPGAPTHCSSTAC